MLSIMQRILAFDAESASADELIETRALGRTLEAEYSTQRYEVPERVKERLEALDTQIAAKRADSLKRRLKELDAADAADRTLDEKRQDRRAERERIASALTA